MKMTRGIAQTSQGRIGQSDSLSGIGFTAKSNLATVITIYTDRNTADITTWNGSTMTNVPFNTKVGLINNEIYGELDPIFDGATVLVDFIEGNYNRPYIVGAIVPYLVSQYQTSQKAVNSSSKQFTKKLFEPNLKKTYRRIFKSGTTIEVQEDGSVIIETPTGGYFQMKESDKTFTIKDAQGNIIQSSGTSVKINNNLEVKQ